VPSPSDGLRRIALDPSHVEPGSTLRPSARFVAERGGVEQASVVFGQAEIFEREPDEYALARLAWTGDWRDAACDVMNAAVHAKPSAAPVYFPVNAAVQGNHADRRAIAEVCGLRLFQEKEGFWWSDTGQDLPEPAGLRFRPMSQIGSDPFVSLIARCQAATLDRTDALVFPRHRPELWAAKFLDHHAQGPDQNSWLRAESADGEPIGFVGVSRRQGDAATGVITLIGVLPQHRGHRYVDQLLYAAYQAARTRGFTGVLALVDVDNHPMTAAVYRTGARADTHPWHKWLYVSP
jgi:GNAT superfamily N-acetyltransferase